MMMESGELNWERLTWRFMLVKHRKCREKGTPMSHEGKVKGKVLLCRTSLVITRLCGPLKPCGRNDPSTGEQTALIQPAVNLERPEGRGYGILLHKGELKVSWVPSV